MSILKFISFDFKNGLARNWQKYLVVLGVSVLFSFALSNELPRAQEALKLPATAPTLGDYLVNLVAGISKYVFNMGTPFRFPASWLLVFLLVAYITLNYPYRDLMGSGKQLLIEAGSRWAWWLSKCVWVTASVLVFFASCVAGVLIWLAITRGSLSLEVSAAVPTALGFYTKSIEPQTWQLDAWLFLSIPLVTIAICLVQMLVSLVVKPIFSFICTIGLLFFSAYFQTDALIGNFLMAARCSSFNDGGMQAQTGIVIAVGTIAIAVIAGGFFFKNMDILEWGHET